MDLKTHLLMERCRLQREIDELIKKIDHLPAGQIHFDRNDKYWKWRQSFEDPHCGYRILSKKEDALAQDLVEKRHLFDRLEILRQQINMIDQFLLEYPNAQILFDPSREPCQDYWKLLQRTINIRQQKIDQWLHEPYESCSDHPEQKIYKTKCGILVRSKSEVLIADSISDDGIAFRYEQALKIGDQTVYPDFAMLDPVNLTDVIYLEHYGMMDVPAYVQRAKMKQGLYLESGLITSGRVMFSYESKEYPLDINYIRMLIHYRLGTGH